MPTPKPESVVRIKQRKQPTQRVLKLIYDDLALGCGIELACHCSNVDPADFERWMTDDPTIYRRVMRETSLFERDLILKAKAGGKTMCQSRASLEMLSRISTRFAPKSSVTVRKELDNLLDELEKQLDAPTYLKVLGIIETHAK